MDIVNYLPELLSVTVIAIFMAISPGADFVMITRNSLFHGRQSGLYSALGIGLAIWIHVAYSIAGLAIIISKSILLFSLIKYLGAAYLIYIGYKTLTAKSKLNDMQQTDSEPLSNFAALKLGFITNALNPKTTLFFLSLFTQVVNPSTPVSIQILYGLIICLAHIAWFSMVSMFFSHPALVSKFNIHKQKIEKVVGSVLIGFGIKVAVTTNN
ncbi:LysE family translocator [Psychromonas sp. 14N.309.X.WAT.B.A12]|uniref:LysE family translocator n=1 Tax=unclassified Psychromonas TaxID=2614957 RepID=UPI0025AECEBE|nr:LysE family transporter [Psychromonas sp. 14N.309.X.WAT.B.A12]MDN2662967.1 LysE family transporter [Psychromonas sp. 14N.309.X.WAT.B.A12]